MIWAYLIFLQKNSLKSAGIIESIWSEDKREGYPTHLFSAKKLQYEDWIDISQANSEKCRKEKCLKQMKNVHAFI